MYTISVNAGHVMWKLVYKERPEPQIAEMRAFQDQQHFHQQIAGQKTLTISDDFGQEMTVAAGQLHAVLLEDLDLSQDAIIKLQVHQQLMQLKFQQELQRNPTLRTARTLGNGLGGFDPTQLQRN
jgi:hypothetical protein